MTWPTSVDGEEEEEQQQQQQPETMTSTLDGDGLQAATCGGSPDRQDVEEIRRSPAWTATAADAVDSATEADGSVATTSVRHNSVSLSEDDNDQDDMKLVIDSSGNHSSDSEHETIN